MISEKYGDEGYSNTKQNITRRTIASVWSRGQVVTNLFEISIWK